MSDHRSVRRHSERKNIKRKGRSLQRQRALDVLFEADIRGFGIEKTRHLLIDREEISTAQQPIQEYGARIVTEFLEHNDNVDSMIDAASPQWALHRMSAVDRNILRIATAELMFLDVERPIAVKEAASLAREFSAEKSVPFIMGVLNRVADIYELETSGTGFEETQILGESPLDKSEM